MNNDQINSMVRTALKLISGAIIAHGGSQVLASQISAPDVTELVAGLIIAALSAYASHKTHSPVSTTVAQNQTQNIGK